MVEPLSKSHRILEKGLLQFRPFGVEENGERIRDTTGVKVRAFVDYLEESVARSRGHDAGEQAVQTLLLKPFDAGQLREMVERWFAVNASVEH
jgi:hypothetical protein